MLERAGVPVVSDLPGTGHGYQDHNLIFYPYKTSLAAHETADGLLSGRTSAATLIGRGDKMLGWNAIDVAAKIRPTDAEVEALGPEFQAAWDRDFRSKPDRPLVLIGLAS